MLPPSDVWAAAKLAVTVVGAFTVTFCGVVAPVRPPEKPVKTYPELAVALTGTIVPESTKPDAGEMLPSVAEGDTCVVNRYWILKFAVMVLADEGAVTLCEIAPESLQFNQTYCVLPDVCGDEVATV
jgi:hypothetical protein